MEQGKTEESILRQCLHNRMPVPEAILNAPELFYGSEFFLQAYLELSTCKVFGGPIPWSAVLMYCQAHDLDDDLMGELMFVVRFVDEQMNEHHRKKTPPPPKPGKP